MSGRRAIRLNERVEDEFLFVFRYPRSGIADRKVQTDFRGITAFAIDLHYDLPARGKLDRVVHEISNDLPKPGRIAHECVGDLRIDPHGEFEAFGVCADPEGLERFAHALAQAKVDRFQLQMACLDF